MGVLASDGFPWLQIKMKSRLLLCLCSGLLFFMAGRIQAEEFNQGKPLRVLLDAGNPENSVAVLGEDVLQFGDLYDETYRVIAFQRKSVVVEDESNKDRLRWFEKGELDSKALQKGRAFFAVRQMRAIFEAQIMFQKHHGKGFAPSLRELIRQGFLPDGFKKGVKQSYKFRIEKTGEYGRRAPDYDKDPFFLAVAEPLNQNDGWYFSVDELGLVRYAASLAEVSWGPGWDYMDMTPPASEYAGVA